MKVILILLAFAFALASCQADPSAKKIPFVKKRLVNKGVDVDFFPAVDILFIIDDSGSMSEYQRILADQSAVFTEEFFKTRFLDFQVGVTSSTNEDIFSNARTKGGKLLDEKGPHFITRDTTDGQEILEDYLKIGTSGSGSEEFLSILRQALSDDLRKSANKDFYREDAHLLIIFVTDTDDQATDPSADPIEVANFIRQLKNNNNEKITVAGALILEETPSCRRWGELHPEKILAFMEEFEGTSFALCDNNYGTELVKIAKEVVRKNSTIKLKQVPVVETLELYYGSQLIPEGEDIGWTYNPKNNEIYLAPGIELKPERRGTRVRVKFESAYR